MDRLVCTFVLTFDELTRMSKWGDSPDCEYGWWLRECERTIAATFIHGDVCASRHVGISY